MKNLFLHKAVAYEDSSSILGFNLTSWLKKQLTYLGVTFQDPCCPTPPVPPVAPLFIYDPNFIGSSSTYIPPNGAKIITVYGTTGSTLALPKASTCVGQIYILKNISTINTFAGDTNEATTSYPSYATKTFMIQSTGVTNSWILLSVF